MPEEINDKKVFTLLQVMRSVQQTLADRYKSPFWVKAEMNKLNFYPQSGHCYPDLVEKKDGKLIAQVRSNLWRDDFLRINAAFKSIVKEPLKDGIKILFSAAITFDPNYGLSLRIIDIDPSYSLGDLEQEKHATIEQLKKEGVYGNNKLFTLPLLPKRIAIISVDTSKGYADFIKVIEGNEWGYKFSMKLFPALLQGEKAVETIIYQLRQIKSLQQHFDVVAIIRGGGGDIGLSCYNDFRLSREVALFPLPVITGIGHSTNETVVEMIAFENAITPTKLAEYLLQKFHNFSVPLHRAEEKLIDLSQKILRDEQLKFRNAILYFRSVTSNMVLTGHNNISNLQKAILQQTNFQCRSRNEAMNNTIRYFRSVTHNLLLLGNNKVVNLSKLLQQQTGFRFKSQNNDINNLQRTINNLSPENVLKRGYSITILNGKAIKNYQDVKAGDKIETVVMGGIIKSTVNETSKSAES